MNKICPKLNLKHIFEQLLFISVNHLSKNRFLSKLFENGRFLLNKFKKIIRNQIFFHKIKIAQNVGFPHRFSFSGQKVTPMGLPDASGPPVAFGCLGRGRMREVEIKGGICYHLATLELLVPIDTSY